MKSDDSEREFWNHYEEIITSFRTLEYKSKQTYLELENKFSQSEYQLQNPIKSNFSSKILWPFFVSLLLLIKKNLRKLLESVEGWQFHLMESVEERQLRVKIQSTITEDV